MDRKQFVELWNESWSNDTWIAAWSKALDGLTPAQATWTPPQGKHSIWQIVNHVNFWREVTLAKSKGETAPSSAECERRNFEAPANADAANWDRAKVALQKSHEAFSAALGDPNTPLDRIKYHLPHDAYHLGQIMQLRAMQGMGVIV